MASKPLPLIPWSKTCLSTERASLDASVPVHCAAVDLFVLGYPNLANRLIDALYEHSHGIEFKYSGVGEIAVYTLYPAWDVTDTMPSYIKNPDPDKIFNGRGSDENGDEFRWSKPTKDIEKDPEAWAKKVEKDEVVAVYRHVQDCWDKEDVKDLRKWMGKQVKLHHRKEVWEMLKDAEISKALDVDEGALEAFVTEGCDLIKQRFTKGPARPYADHSIAELLRILDEKTIERHVDPDSDVDIFNLELDGILRTYLKPPVDSAAIAALEDRLSSTPSPDDEGDSPMLPDKHLPPDYKEFLETTNGFEDEPGSQDGIFCAVEEVGKGDVTWLHDLEYLLFPYDHTTYGDIDNIPLGEWSGFHVGAGGDEGNVVLIPPTYVKPVLEAFEKAYAAASEREKRLYERAAMDLYGGLEALRKMEWLCLVSYHWDPEEHIWGSFRECLEYFVVDAVRQEKRARKNRKERKEKAEKEKEEKKRKQPEEAEKDTNEERKVQRTE